MKKALIAFGSFCAGICLIVLGFALKKYLGWWFLALVILGVTVALSGFAALSAAGKKSADEPQKVLPEYVRKKSLLSEQEKRFYSTLLRLFSGRYLVHFQVPLVSVIDKKTCTSYRNELFRVADFCLCDPDTFEPLLLIELNDSSHNRPERRERDIKVAQICAAAGMPLVVVHSYEMEDVQLIKKLVAKNVLR